MSAVTVANLAPAVGRAAVARRAVSSGSSRSSPFVGAKVASRPSMVPRAVRASATIARARDPTSDPRDSPIARIAAGVDAPAAAPERAFDVRAAFRSTVERLWNARKAVACAALAVVLSLADAGAAVAGRSGRSGGRMGGSSFRSTSSRSMGGGGFGAAGRGAGAGAAAASATGRAPPPASARATPPPVLVSVSACPPSSSCPASATATGTARWAPGT